MVLLDECRELREDIRMIEEKIEENALRVSAPKNQSFDDTPKSPSSFGNPIESYIEKKERLEERKKALTKKLDSKWREVVGMLTKLNIPVNEITLLYYRFYVGDSWDVCGKKLNWNENKVFRVYRRIRETLENSMV